MYKLHSLQHPDWHRTGTSYCYCYIIEIIHHDSVIFSKTYPSFLTVKEGDFLPLRLSCKESSTFLTKPLFPQEREDVTALRCSEPLRYKVGGPSKVFAMVVRDGTALMQCFLYLIFSIIYMNQQKAKTSYKYDFIFSLTLLQIQRNLQRS